MIASQKYTGNGLQIRKKTNDGHLSVIGNGCVVKITENSGLVEIIGNGCRVVVKNGTGSVVYVGNGGFVDAAPGIEVTYRGCSGKVMKEGKTIPQTTVPTKFSKNVMDIFNENGRHMQLPNSIVNRIVLPNLQMRVN